MKKTVTFHCAFEDDQGQYVDPKELTKEQAIVEAVARNIVERDRLKGKTPDAVWFVVKAETDYCVVARPEIPAPRKKVVRRVRKK